MESYLPVLSTLTIQIERLSKMLRRVAPEDEDVRLLMTIPGVGYYSALLVKSEIGNIDRFPDGENLCSYAGLVPSVSSSGAHKRYGSITKEGSVGYGGLWLNQFAFTSNTTRRSVELTMLSLNGKAAA